MASSSKAFTVVALGCAAASLLSVYLLFVRGSENNEHDDGDEGKSGNQPSCPPDLPPHLQRELYKEQRRKESVRFLALKRPMYDNIEMYDPDGVLLCTIGKKKAHWYVSKKGLAVWKTPLTGENDKNGSNPGKAPSIQLLFTPKNSKNKENDNSNGTEETQDEIHPNRVYNSSHKRNICVACGSSIGLMRHYVVPYSYRRLLPTKFKSHLPHDIVLLCMDCHMCADHAQ